MGDLLHNIHGRGGWHSSATRQHDLHQRWRRERFFVHFICALGRWNFVLRYLCILLTFAQTWKLRQRATDDIFQSQCLVCRVDGDEFSPVSWLVRCGRGAAVADWDRVVQLWWLRYEVWWGLWSSLLPQHFLPPSFSHILASFFLTHQITHSCGNFKENREEGNGTITQSITSKKNFLFTETLHPTVTRLCQRMHVALQQTTKVCVLSNNLSVWWHVRSNMPLFVKS